MDNILKLLLGVLGVSGMIAMVTSNLSFEPQQQQQSQINADDPPIVMQPVDESVDESEEPLPEDEVAEAVEEDGDDIFAIGEPSIDGNPYGTNNQQQPQNDNPMPVDMAQAGSFNYGQAAPQSYDQPQYYGPQPAPGGYAPAAIEGQ
jgi:hypothetical protein